MASSKEYLDFILEQLSQPEDLTFRAMMGEYIIYYRGKIVGGIYDDRFLLKPTASVFRVCRRKCEQSLEGVPITMSAPL